jgi:hypothetical protein
MKLFNITYDIVTPESAECGEIEESGFVIEHATLRDAIKALFGTRTNQVDGIECIENNLPYGLRVINGMEFLTGATESRTMHFPSNITMHSAFRIARLLGA